MIRWTVAVVLALVLSSSGGAQQIGPSAPSTIPSSALASITARNVAAEQRAPLPYDSPSGHIFFRVKIGGQESWGMLDTGSTASIIDVDLAKAGGLTLEPHERPILIPGGTMARWHANQVSVLLPGQAELEYSRLAATDLGMLRISSKRPVGFILGLDLLSRFFVIVDPDKQVLRFAPTGLFKPSPHFRAVPLRGGKPVVEFDIGGKLLLATLDTGKNGDLDVQPTLWSRYVPADLGIGTTSTIALDGKLTVSKKAILPQVDLGPVRMSGVQVTERALPESWEQGSLGMGILGRFRFVIDINAQTLWLAPRSAVGASHQSLQSR